MPHSLKSKIKSLCYKGEITEKERDRIIHAVDSYDKIIEQIEDEAEYAYADFDKYKEDILYAEPDELPDDDFRYGLRRAIEIIRRYNMRLIDADAIDTSHSDPEVVETLEEAPTVKAIPKYKIDEAIEKIKTMRNSVHGSYLKTSAYKEGIDDVLLIIEEACK